VIEPHTPYVSRSAAVIVWDRAFGESISDMVVNEEIDMLDWCAKSHTALEND
jgi:hypothetical protein